MSVFNKAEPPTEAKKTATVWTWKGAKATASHDAPKYKDWIRPTAIEDSPELRVSLYERSDHIGARRIPNY